MGVKGVKIKGGEHFPVITTGILYYFLNFKMTSMHLKICYMFNIFCKYMQLNV